MPTAHNHWKLSYYYRDEGVRGVCLRKLRMCTCSIGICYSLFSCLTFLWKLPGKLCGLRIVNIFSWLVSEYIFFLTPHANASPFVHYRLRHVHLIFSGFHSQILQDKRTSHPVMQASTQVFECISHLGMMWFNELTCPDILFFMSVKQGKFSEISKATIKFNMMLMLRYF